MLTIPFKPRSNPRWFTLCRKPNQTKKKKDSSSYVLAPVSIGNSPPAQWSDLISVDHNLYAISKPMEAPPCSQVSFLDCRTHTWLKGPSLKLAHTDSPFDGDLYLPGSSEDPESLYCMEVFNTKTETWKPVPTEKRMYNLGNLEGKIHICSDDAGPGSKGVTIKPKDMTIDPLEFEGSSICMINNIIYCFCSNGVLQWSNGSRRKVEGLEGLPNLAGYTGVKMVDYGGKMMVFWDKYLPLCWFREKMIWCAVISFEKRGSEQIWGTVEWVDAVLTVPKAYKFVYAVAATL